MVSTIRHRSDIESEATLRVVSPAPALRGVYVPLVTPYAADGSVDLDAVERLAVRYLDAGVAGLVPLGTTGETPLLEHGREARHRRGVHAGRAGTGRPT